LIAPAALLLADSRTPSGSYAHSAGLEAAVHDGLRTDGVPAFLRARLHSVAFSEAAITAAAVRAGGDPVTLDVLDAEAVARTPSPALRAAATTLGRAILRTGAQLFPADAAIGPYRARSETTPRPVALGVVCTAAGLRAEDAALLALYDDAATVAAAAAKLLPVDSGAAAGWIAGLTAELEALAAAAAAAAELPSACAPLIELRSLRHRADQGRLFAS
jgi:urease accessory protein